jgi:nicotinamide phosphoribosyltransferase
MVKNIIPSLKDEVLAHNGKLLIRPDSGDQVETVVNTILSLWDTFGGTINTKGYKVLNPHIGVILGDGCTLYTVREIWRQLNSLKFAANNVIFGVGAFCFTAMFEGDKMIVNTRDTWGVAMKATYGKFGNQELMIYKDPKTDTDNLKKSHKGLIFVERDGDNFKVTDGLMVDTYGEYMKTHETAFRTVFINGEMFNRESFTTIRERLANEK